MRYALTKDGATIKHTGDYDERPRTGPNGSWFEYVEVVPSLDPDTEVAVGHIDAIDIDADTATRTFTKRSKTAQEMDDEKDAMAALPNKLTKAVALVLLDEVNLLRAEHQLAARTPAQLRNAVKAKL